MFITYISNTMEQIGLLRLWRKDIFLEYTLSEAVHHSKRKTKTWVFNTLKILATQNYLHIEKKGNVNVYRLNTKNPCALQALQFLDAKPDFSQIELIQDIISHVPSHCYCLIVFGSYVTKQVGNSDIDICFLVENETMGKRMKPYVREAKLEHTVDLDDHYITFDDFVRMLLRKEENLGKQVYRKHMLFYNPDIYYSLIKEAHNHGFRA